MSAYSPFGKSLDSIEGQDLSRLFEVPEGWYVEYKREVPNASSIAKSISAFANTYGGWLFYGVSEKSKEESVAGDLKGIPVDELDGALQRIRQACATSINPTPYYQVRTLSPDVADVEDERRGHIICIHIPKSHHTPHVHRDGRIYRRVADGSEPKPESDRFLLDQLWGRGKKVMRGFKKWERNDPQFSKGESNQPYIRFLLTPHDWNQREVGNLPSFETVRKLFIEKPETRNIPFDTIFENQSGYVVRQCKNVDPFHLSFTWILRRDFSSEVMFPLYVIDSSSPVEEHSLGLYSYAGRFFDELEKAKFNNPKVLDLNLLFVVIKGIVKTYRELMRLAGIEPSFYVKARLLNCWRTVPFFDMDFAFNNIIKNGIPMILNKVVSSPEGSGPDSFFKVREQELAGEFNTEDMKSLFQAVAAFIPLTRAFGLSFVSEVLREDDNAGFYPKIEAAANRGVQVAAARNSLRATT